MPGASCFGSLLFAGKILEKKKRVCAVLELVMVILVCLGIILFRHKKENKEINFFCLLKKRGV